MKKMIILSFLLFLTAQLFSQHLLTERSVNRGELLRAYIYPSEGIVKSRFILSNYNERTITDTEGFLFEIDGNSIETALLGIPSDLTPGKYLLKVYCETAEGSDQFTKPIFITDRTYFNEEIELDRTMSTLRGSEDPQKAEQSRQLWSVISSLDKNNQFFFESFQNPIDDYILTSNYGDRRTFIYNDGSENKSLHYGSDMYAPEGTSISSAGDGKVVMAENRILTGNTIIIEHLPGVYTLYYHMDSLEVELGMVVEKGTVIGTVGSTGLVTGPHLHWELRVSTIAVDPLLFIESPLIDKVEIMNIIDSIH